MGLRAAGPARAVDLLACPGRGDYPLARLPEPEGFTVVKKLLVVFVLALSAVAVLRKVHADRAELNLWTAATTDED